MTDPHVAASPAVTLLAGYLESTHPRTSNPRISDQRIPCADYRGVCTPVELDARANEIAALAQGAAVHDLGWMRRVAVRGEDRLRWLSGMVTNMVKDLPSGTGAANFILNVQGRIQGDLTVWREKDDVELEIAADQYDKLLEHLDRFIVMDDVELKPVEGETAIGLTGPKAGEVLARLGLPALPEALTEIRAEWGGGTVLVRRDYGVLAEHYEIWIAEPQAGALWEALTAASAKPVGSAALEAFRIAEGIPAYGIDVVERDLAQETSQTRALHFNKGCYLGQEIVERIRSRGNVHRYLRSLELDGPVPEAGATLSVDGAEAGHITSAAELPLAAAKRVFALGMIRAEAEARNLPLTYMAGQTTGTARILTGPADL